MPLINVATYVVMTNARISSAHLHPSSAQFLNLRIASMPRLLFPFFIDELYFSTILLEFHGLGLMLQSQKSHNTQQRDSIIQFSWEITVRYTVRRPFYLRNIRVQCGLFIL